MKLLRIVAVTAVAAGLIVTTACDGGDTVPPAEGTDGPGSASSAAVDAPYPRRSSSTAFVVAPVDVPERARAGRPVRAVFQTRADSSCQLEVVYENGTRGHRLSPATADRTGLVSWTWTVDETAVGDVATAVVVCSGGQRGQAQINIL